MGRGRSARHDEGCVWLGMGWWGWTNATTPCFGLFRLDIYSAVFAEMSAQSWRLEEWAWSQRVSGWMGELLVCKWPPGAVG